MTIFYHSTLMNIFELIYIKNVKNNILRLQKDSVIKFSPYSANEV